MRLRAAVILAITATLLVVPAATAQAGSNSTYAHDGLYDVGVTRFSDLAVDQTDGLVLISGGKKLVVANLVGRAQAKVGLPARADMLVLADDDSAAFGIDTTSGTVTRVDLPSLSVTSSASAVASCPSSIAFSAGLLWVADKCPADGNWLVAVEPATLAVVGTFTTVWPANRLIADPAVPDTLFGWNTSGSHSPTHFSRFAVTGGATPGATFDTGMSFVSPVLAGDVAPDGSCVEVLAGTTMARLDSSTLATISTHATGYGNQDVAVRDADVLAYAMNGQEPTYYFATANQDAPVTYSQSGYYELRGSLEFGATQLYWVVKKRTADGTTSYRLGIGTPALSTTVSISTSKTDKYDYRQPVTVTAAITSPADPTGMNLEIYGKTSSGSPVLLGSGVVDSSGVLQVTFRVKEYTTLTAVFPGDGTYAPAVATTHVKCYAGVKDTMVRPSGKQGKYALYHSWQDAVMKVHVAPNHAGDRVLAYWDYYAGGRWHAGTTSGIKVVLNSRSNGFYLAKGDRSLIGVRIKVRTTLPSTHRNDVSLGSWAYFKFVK